MTGRTSRLTGRARGLVLVVSAGFIWSTIPLGVRLMDEATAPQIVFYRAIFQVLFLLGLLLVRYRGRIVAPFLGIGWSGLIGAVALAVAYVSIIVALTNTSVGNAVFLLSTAPLLAALIARVTLGERVKGTTWFAMALAAGGVGIMVSGAIGAGELAGNVAALLAGIGYAVFTVVLRGGRDHDMIPTIALSGVLAAVIASFMTDDFAITGHDLAITAYLGAVAIGFGLVLYNAGAVYLTAAELPLFAMLEVVASPFWVWMFLGETMSASTIVGGVVVLIAVLIQALLGHRWHRHPIGATA